jgi:hypothetical protein
MGAKALFIEHPTDSSNHVTGLAVGYQRLGPYLPPLFRRAFVEGLHQPSARPTADDWENALARSQDLLLPCGNAACDDKWFLLGDEPPRCPWCGWQPSERTPVLEFHYSPVGRKGQYRPENHRLTAHEGRRLHRWHAFRNARPGEAANDEVLAYITCREGRLAGDGVAVRQYRVSRSGLRIARRRRGVAVARGTRPIGRGDDGAVSEKIHCTEPPTPLATHFQYVQCTQ